MLATRDLMLHDSVNYAFSGFALCCATVSNVPGDMLRYLRTLSRYKYTSSISTTLGIFQATSLLPFLRHLLLRAAPDTTTNCLLSYKTTRPYGVINTDSLKSSNWCLTIPIKKSCSKISSHPIATASTDSSYFPDRSTCKICLQPRTFLLSPSCWR